jgi:beta-glucanase (GH16 family)
MMHLLISIAIIIQVFSPAPRKRDKMKLVWSDEFNINGAPDTAKWAYDLGNGDNGWGNQELQSYTNSPDNVYVKGGKLVIEAKKKDNQWTSARLKTLGKKSWTYGKIVFRAKLPTGKGTWPALWMLGENITTVGWPACGEIDIMEHVGRNPGVIQSAMHTIASHGDTVDKNSKTVGTFDTKFHTYEVLWTEQKIEFFIDGDSFYTYQPSVKDNTTWPYNAPFFIIMNIAIGGGFGGDVDPVLNFARMEIDYVRVYATVESKS